MAPVQICVEDRGVTDKTASLSSLRAGTMVSAARVWQADYSHFTDKETEPQKVDVRHRAGI